MRPRAAGQSGRIANSFITTSSTRAVISPLGNNRRCFPPRCELHSGRSANRFNTDQRAPIGALTFPETKEGIVNHPEGTFATQQIRLERRLPSYWRVTFDLPPVNIFGPKETLALSEIITAIEKDEQVKVVVFDSAVDGFFLTHYDFLAPLEESAKIPAGPTGFTALPRRWEPFRRGP